MQPDRPSDGIGVGFNGVDAQTQGTGAGFDGQHDAGEIGRAHDPAIAQRRDKSGAVDNDGLQFGSQRPAGRGDS
jgi:hypothetical protein